MAPARVIPIGAGRRGGGSAIALLTDRRLARLAAKGDSRAFATIYERHHQDIFRYCRSITGNPEDASDALQNTMTAALRALPGERRDIALRPWLFRIAHNESVSIIRRRSNYADLTEANEPTSPGPHTVVAMRERLSGLLADLGSLPERQRGALVMRELIGLDYGEIADALNVSAGAARQAVYEARVALAQSDQGREMACEAARQSISAGDGRVLRGRRLRAHMRGCSPCTDFSEQLGVRRSTLPALLPPLPAAAGVAILGGLVGGAATVGAGGASIGALGSAGSGGVMSLLAGGASQAAGASAVAKGAAAAVAVAVVAGVGTVEVKKAVDSPAPPAHTKIQKHAGSRAEASRVSLTPARPGLAARRRGRTDTVRRPATAPQSGTPAGQGGGAPGSTRRAPRSLQRRPDPGIRPVSDPTPAPQAPAPAPVSAPAPAAPVSPPASPPVQPWQQQYTDSMRQAQLGLQLGSQVYQGAMQLTQQIISGIFPRAQQR